MGVNIGPGISIEQGISITQEFDIPHLESNPVVSGNAIARGTVISTTGVWSTIQAPTYTYQWQHNVSNIGNATNNTYVISSAYVGEYLDCVVKATNSYGNSSATSNSFGPILANTPLAPTSVVATTGSPVTTAVISFGAPTDNGGAAITNYTATSNTGGFSNTSTNSPISISGLTSGQIYTFNVTATNSVGTGPSTTSNSLLIGVNLTFANTITGTANNEVVRTNPLGTTIYTVSETAGIKLYTRNTSTGALTLASTKSNAYTDMIFSADGNYIFTLAGGTYLVYNSSFTSIASGGGGLGAQRFAVTPDNQFLYSCGFRVKTGGGFEGVIYINKFDTSTNTITAVSTNLFTSGGVSSVFNIFTSSDGKNLYILNYGVTGGGEGLYKFDINATTGALTNQVAYDAGVSPSAIMSNDNKNIYVGLGGATGNIINYSRNTSTGNLTLVSTTNIGSLSDPTALSILPTDNILFTQSGYFGRDLATGNITFYTGSTTYNPALWSVVTPDGKNLYKVDTSNSYSISTYNIS